MRNPILIDDERLWRPTKIVPPISERFWSRVNKNGTRAAHMPDACWIWEGYQRGKGYGSISWNDRLEKTHRVSWILHCGPIPIDMSVLHKCDTRLCVRPTHLYLGTHVENMADVRARGKKALQ